MIRLPMNNPITPINLLQQNYPHQLMRKCHLGEAQRIIGFGQDFFPKADGAADDENDMAVALDAEGVDLFRQFFRSELFAVDF